MVDVRPNTPLPLETEHKDLARHGTPKSTKLVPFSSLDSIIRPRSFSSITSAPSQQPQPHFLPHSIPTTKRHDPIFNPPNFDTRINDWDQFLQKPVRKPQTHSHLTKTVFQRLNRHQLSLSTLGSHLLTQTISRSGLRFLRLTYTNT